MGAASAILVPPTPHAQVLHPSRGSHTRAVVHQRCSKPRQGGIKEGSERGYGGDDMGGGVAELILESNVQREEDGERRGVVSRNVGAGEAT